MNVISSYPSVTLAVIAFVASFVMGFPIRVVLRWWGVVDLPNTRSSHDRPTVRGGGIAIITALAAVSLTAVGPSGSDRQVWGSLILAAVALALISFLDDWKSLPTGLRLGFHALASVFSLSALGWPQILLAVSADMVWSLPLWCSSMMLCLWIVGYTNAFNFMDGVNGIASTQALITALGTGLLGAIAGGGWSSLPILVSFVIAGAAAGFLPHNFPRARMFMGDVGSAPLGFLLASLTIWMAKVVGWWLLIPISLLHANFVLDTFITLVRRIIRGERWDGAHREHFYQRLIRSGKSHAFVTTAEVMLQCVVLSLMIAYLHAAWITRLVLILIVIALWLAFFTYCEALFRRSGRSAVRAKQPSDTEVAPI